MVNGCVCLEKCSNGSFILKYILNVFIKSISMHSSTNILDASTILVLSFYICITQGCIKTLPINPF